jgi:hypothetical protein
MPAVLASYASNQPSGDLQVSWSGGGAHGP